MARDAGPAGPGMPTSRNVARQRLGASDMLQLARLATYLALTYGERRERVVQHVIHVSSTRARQGKPPLAARLIILLALCATPRIAAAQAAVETPTEMFEPEKGRGLPLSGGLILYNQTRLEAQYDSNIYNVEQSRTSDVIGLIDSNFRLATRLPRHEAEIRAGLTVRRYADTSDENSDTYRVDGRTFFDLGSRIGLRVRGGYAREVEQRGTAGDQFATDRPVRHNDLHLEAEIDRTGGILETSLTGSFQRRRFLDATINGVTIDLGHRDATIRRVAFQASYRFSPVMRLYAQVGSNQVDYRRKLEIPRDSSGYSALVGVRYEVTRLIDVQAAVGFIHQSFDAPGAKSVNGINYRLQGTWTPTPKWRVTASGERVADASPLSEVPAIIRSTFDLRVQRALGSRMLVEAGIAYTDEDYRGLGRNDRRYSGFGNVQYRVTNNIAAVVGAGYRKQAGGGNGRSYSGASVSAGLRIAL